MKHKKMEEKGKKMQKMEHKYDSKKGSSASPKYLGKKGMMKSKGAGLAADKSKVEKY